MKTLQKLKAFVKVMIKNGAIDEVEMRQQYFKSSTIMKEDLDTPLSYKESVFFDEDDSLDFNNFKDSVLSKITVSKQM